MSEDKKEGTILYKCPYCTTGRFTAEDGWEGACRHIKEKHLSSKRKRKKEEKPLLDEDEACYSGNELLFAPP